MRGTCIGCLLLLSNSACTMEEAETTGRTLQIRGPEKIRNGDTVTLRVDAGLSNVTLGANFSQIDSAFDPNLVEVRNAGNGVFEITYTLSTANQRPDGSYPIHVSVDLGRGLTLTETFQGNLSNRIARAGTVQLNTSSARISAFASKDTVLGFTLDATTSLQFGGLDILASGVDAGGAAAITKAYLYQDTDLDGEITGTDSLIAEGVVRTEGETGFVVDLRTENKLPITTGRASFLIGVDTSCSSNALVGQKFDLTVPADRFYLKGPNNETPDLGGAFPLKTTVEGAAPFEKLWEATLGLLPETIDWGAGADINGDGVEEIYLLSKNSPWLSLLRSPTFTGFESVERYDLGVTSLSDVSFIDIDADEVLDVVVASDVSRGVTVALSSETYKARVFNLRPRATPLLIGRGLTTIEGDGKWDLIALDPKRSTIVVGTAKVDPTTGFTITPSNEIATGLTGVTGFATADVTGNGATDVILATTDLLEGALYIYSAPKKDGAYELLNKISGQPRIDLLKADDLNADGFVDVVIANRQGTLKIIELSPEGLPTTRLSKTDLSGPTALDLVRVAGEVTDIVALENAGSTIRVLSLNFGLGVSKDTAIDVDGLSSSAVSATTDPFFADLDGDGVKDLVAPAAPPMAGVAAGSNRIAAFKQTGGVFTFRFATDPDPAPAGVALLSESGRVKNVMVPDTTNKKLYSYEIGSLGSLGAIAKTVDTAAGGLAVRTGILQSGTTEDLALLLSGGSIAILKGSDLSTSTTLSAGSSASRLRAFDVNGDGLIDLGGAEPESSSASYFINSGGSFSKFSIPLLPGPEDFLLSVDVDGDGKLDAISIYPTGKAIAYSTGDATTGTFSAPSRVSIRGVPTRLASGDVDGDGAAEVLVGLTNGTLLIYDVGGADKLTLARSIDLGGEIGSMVVEDFDVDGKPDLLALVGEGTGSPLPSALFLKSLGDGTFCAPAAIRSPSGEGDIALGDLDGDGAIDAVFLGKGDKKIVGLRNTFLD